MLKLGTFQKMNTNKLIAVLFGVMFLFSLASASAFEFDNVKNYNSITREVTITNAFGLGDTIGKARLNTPLNYKVEAGKNKKLAEFDLWAYEDYNDILKNLEIYDNSKADWENHRINKNIDIKYKILTEIEIDDYKYIEELSKNGSIFYNKVKVGSHFEILEEWKKVTPAVLKKNEHVIVGLFGDLELGEKGEWILSIYGERVTEWASYEGTGGTVTIDGNYTVHTFTSSGDFNWSGDSNNISVLVVAGGGGGGSGGTYGWEASGGGAGGLLYNSSFPVTEQIYSVTVGDGGVGGTSGSSGSGSQGGNSVFSTMTSIGGGFGVCGPSAGGNGGSGGGGSHISTAGGTGISGQGYAGGNGGSGIGAGGGGAGEVGFNAGTGGDGIAYSINGILTYYAGGGGGAGAASPKSGGLGGGGDSLAPVNTPAEAGTPNTGGGGGGTWSGTSVTGGLGGSGIVIIRYLTYDPDKAPNITLNSPSSVNETTTQNLIINFTASDDIDLTNVQLYVNGILNQSNASGINNSNYLFDLNLTDGNYTIKGIATDNNSVTTNSTSINIFIDSTAPTINLTSPLTNTTTSTLPINVSLNTTTADLNLNSCWYYTSDNATNITYTCNTATNISFSTGGDKVIYAFVNDSLGNENSTSASFLINYIQESATYDVTVIEGESTTLILNITASQIDSFNGTLHYNGTDYTPSVTDDGTTGLLTYVLSAPLVTANDLVNFNWTYTLNAVEYNSSAYNQTIVFLTPLNISSSCIDKALRFDIQDEVNLSALTGDIKYNFKYGITNGSLKEIFGSIDAVTTFYVCVNASVSTNYSVGYGEIQYTDADYVDRRYYLFEDQTISNNTLSNISLRSLENAEQTSFLLTMEDTSLNFYTNKYTALWRWYPDLNEYQIVEMGKTDEDGQTVSHIDTEDVDYRVGLYYLNGTLIKLGEPVRFICTSAPCSFTLRVGDSAVDYDSFFDVQAEISYNESTGMFTLIYNDPNSLTSSMRFEVIRQSGSSTLVICNDTSSGFTGVMSCNTSMYNGLKTATAYRSASPPIVIAQKIVSKINTTFKSSFGLFISVFLWLAIVLSGFGNNPIWTILLGIIGLIPAVLLGSINITIFTGIAVLGAIIIHFIKRSVAR